MPVVTVADVLRRAREFERMLEEFYAGLSEKSTREGVRMLLRYMSRHSRRIADALDGLSEERLRRIESAQLAYEPQAADCRCFEGVRLSPDATAAEVLDVAVSFDECLVRLCKQVVQQAVDQDVKVLFENLIRTEELDEIELKKIKAMDYF